MDKHSKLERLYSVRIILAREEQHAITIDNRVAAMELGYAIADINLVIDAIEAE